MSNNSGIINPTGGMFASAMTQENVPMELLALKEFKQLAGILQMTMAEETPEEISVQYTKYLAMEQDQREVFIKTLLKHAKPAIMQLAMMIKVEGI